MGTALAKLRRRAAIVALAALVTTFLLGLTGSAILKALGTFLSNADGTRRSEVAVITPESGKAGELEAADLFHEKIVTRVLVLSTAPGPADLEMARRGVRMIDQSLERLKLLGVPGPSVSVLAAGEGGTTESVGALAAWIQQHPANGVLVITSPTHARRVRRALRRDWRGGSPLPAVCVARFHAFRADDWWRSRGPLREGIIELEKLALDYIRHPF